MEIWIISQFFYQEEFIASERLKRITRYLSKRHKLKIFTSNYSGKEILQKDKLEIINSETFFKEYTFRNFKSTRINIKNFIPQIISKIFGDSGWTWYFQLKSSVFAEIKKQGKPDLIIASGGPFLPFYLCYELKKKFRIPYLLDYRDAWFNNPITYKVNPIFKFIPKMIESKVNKESKSIISVSEATVKSLLRAKNKIVIYNFPDQSYIDYLRGITKKNRNNNNSTLRLTITGTLYPYQTLDSICKAIKMLKPNLRKKIILDYCGSSWQYVDFIFGKYNIKNNLKNYRFIDKKRAIKVLAKGDIAISVISCVSGGNNQTIKGEITTKIFDYIALGKNIINLTFDDYEIIKLLRKIKYQNLFNVNPLDTNKLKRLFESAINEKIEFKKIKLIDSNSIKGLLKESKANLELLENTLKD